ncbi:MAG: hypothetical protein JSR75_00590 [Proteobacteria bacterium]|nr:hypothetical protein [Pseudomonadota bacterium]
MNNRTPLPLAAALALFAALPAAAQDYGAMIQQQMAAMNGNIARGQQMVNGMVRQRMAQMRAAGRPPMDYPTYTYNWIYTAGFSAQGIAHARANEAGIARAEQGKVQELRAAEAQRGQAQQLQRDRYVANQQEAGRGLMGQSTYLAPNNTAIALPHSWQPNTQHTYQGQTYRVDASGNYHVLGSDGWWYPLQARR